MKSHNNTEKINMESGLLVKHHPNFIRWKNAGIREVSLDREGYYLKVDGENEDGQVEQLYLYLTSSDVSVVIAEWAKAILGNGSKWAKFCLKSELDSLRLRIVEVKK